MINLLPYKEKRTIAIVRAIRVGAVTLVAIILLSFTGAVLFIPSLFSINSRYALALNQVKKLENDGQIITATDLGDLEARADVLTKKLVDTTTVEPIGRMNQIMQKAGEGIVVTNLSYEGVATAILKLNGTTNGRAALERFIESLRSDEQVQSVDSPIANYVKNTNSSFTITITFKK